MVSDFLGMWILLSVWVSLYTGYVSLRKNIAESLFCTFARTILSELVKKVSGEFFACGKEGISCCHSWKEDGGIWRQSKEGVLSV